MALDLLTAGRCIRCGRAPGSPDTRHRCRRCFRLVKAMEMRRWKLRQDPSSFTLTTVFGGPACHGCETPTAPGGLCANCGIVNAGKAVA